MKKRILHRFLSGVLVAGLLLGSIAPPVTVYATDVSEENEVEEPVEEQELQAEEFLLNYQEIDFGFEFDEDDGSAPQFYAELPSAYSSSIDAGSADADYVTSVKNQSPYGTCWAHAAISIAESSYIKNKGLSSAQVDALDFNEYHLVHYSYNTPNDLLGITGEDNLSLTKGTSLNNGGNVWFSMQMFANWIGVSDDATFNYSNVDGEHSTEFAYDDAVHLENAYVLQMPDMTSAEYQTDMNTLKAMIMEYGSASISYFSGDTYGDSYGNPYYYCPHPFLTNHAVTIVGWDDSISKDLFTCEETTEEGNLISNTPAGDGAWLVKNSWGDYNGNGGYFWLSYYDESIYEEAYVCDIGDADNYDNNYHHDGTVGLHSSSSSSGECSTGSVFVADSYETLEAIGFYTLNESVDYIIRIYTSLEENEAPQDDEYVLIQSGTEPFIGFHTVELDEPLVLNQGERYAVVVTLLKDGGVSVPVSMSYNVDGAWLTTSVNAKQGESYWGWSVDSLSDLNPDNTTYAAGTDACIKAFTNEKIVVPETGVTVTPATATLASGETVQLTATVAPADATYTGVTYSSSDTTLATVDANGLVTANTNGKSGDVTITATSEYAGITATTTITVLPVPVSSVTLSATNLELGIGGTRTLSATINPANATNKSVNWSSADASIATIDANGKITAIAVGTVTITATAADGSGIKASCTVTVKPVLVSSITLSSSNIELNVDDTYQLTATVNPSNAGNKAVTWSSSDTNIATVDANGKITAHKSGTVTITATATDGSGVSASCTVTVNKILVTKIKLSSTKLKLKVGDTKKLTVTIKPNDAEIKKVKWKSSDPSIAKVNSKGKVTALKPGKVTITATATDGSGVKAKCTITITKPKNGWVEKDGSWYYYEDDEKQKGWVSDGTAWYYTDSDGKMVTGWVYDGAWYYMNSSGQMATGWIYDGAWYYMNSSGTMATGWVYDGANWYYMDSAGLMVTGVQYIDGVRYVFNDSGVWIQ